MSLPKIRVSGDYDLRKVAIKKIYLGENASRLIKLGTVSASCPVINLRRNEQTEIYLKAS
jgi:hypothetical protein